MAKRVGVDKWLFGIVLLLVLFGLVEVFSASAVMAKAQFDSPYPYMAKQALWALLGMIALFVLMQIDYRHYNNPRVVFPVVAVTMVLLMGVFAMRDSHNTHRWIRFGGFLTFQPSELAKPAIILFLA
jgi:cell division protein FtsW